MAVAAPALRPGADGSKDCLPAPNGAPTRCGGSSARHGSVHPFSCHGGSDESCLLFFIVLRKERRDVEAVWSFPLPFEAVEARYPMLTQFVYTNAGTSYSAEELSHTFVLTDGRGVRLYGHCTAFVNGESVVSLSPYPWCRFFTHLATLFRTNGYENGKLIVKALYNCPTPPSGGIFALPDHIPISFQRPYDRLCSFIDTTPVYLLTIFPVTSTLFSVLADLLLEKHVIVVGPNFGLVSQVVMSLQSLISPFDWMHILIPILPSTLLDVLAAPTPYLVGILTSQLPLLESVPIDSCVMIHLGSSGTCEEVQYYNEEKHTLPNSGTFSALRIGYQTLKMQDPRDQTARDLCSLFLTYYAKLLGDIGVCGAAGTQTFSTKDPKDILFYRLLMSTQCYTALIETVQEAFVGDDHAWMDNEFFVALVRGHAKMYPQRYQQLIHEEQRGGGYTTRHADCFGSREELTALSAMIHGFGGHRMSTGRLCCQCLCSLLSRAVCLKDPRALVTLEAVVPPMGQGSYFSAPLHTPEDAEMAAAQASNGTKCPSP
ncbi:Suppression of tumorigenicity 5 [Trypanosoma conorhini]|uniref:Suppression of tumorigenicity 5 n=1 Tax=Trypanosoma conorhini TaxID=83891 RepID=A0A422PZW0_9TRYP|nr:Suppression of tumorigenicity 5 [Trypanosoma conorhini]RNF23282.1 Suppression of tumorigenicity 5 [Trypanosoma conorhini]